MLPIPEGLNRHRRGASAGQELQVIMCAVFDHVDITVSDLAASRAFYHEALGLPTVEGEWVEWGDFGIQPVDDEHPLTQNLHIGFGVADRDAVDAWWNRMTEAGYRSDGDPGPDLSTTRPTTAASSSIPTTTRSKPYTTSEVVRVASTTSGLGRGTSPRRNGSTKQSRPRSVSDWARRA